MENQLDHIKKQVVCFEKTGILKTDIGLISEEPLSIRIQGEPYAVIMRTPGDEQAHVAGFCLAEGVIDSLNDIGAIAFCDGRENNVITITITPERRKMIQGHLDRRGYVSQTSCGICGKEVVEDLIQSIKPISDDTVLDPARALACLETLSDHQPLRGKTKASHAAIVYGNDYALLCGAEDVGRHNALDKVVGRLFLEEKLDRAKLLTLSSRISYELVQKAARARIPVILAISRPTALGVKLASKLNMTLATLSLDDGLIVFCNAHRFKGLERVET